MRVDPAWQALSEHAARLVEARLDSLVAGDPARSRDFALRVGPLYANFARQRYDRVALSALFGLAVEPPIPHLRPPPLRRRRVVGFVRPGGGGGRPGRAARAGRWRSGQPVR